MHLKDRAKGHEGFGPFVRALLGGLRDRGPREPQLPRQQAPRDLIRCSYEAFNARDLDGALAVMHRDVDWPNAVDGGRVCGHEEVLGYWTRQFETIDPRVEPESIREDEDGRIVVDVRQVVRDLGGTVISDQRVQHVYGLRDGLIARMDIR